MSMPKTNIETFYIVDFDRTLADSDKLLEVFMTVSEQHLAIPRSEIEKVDRDVKARGDTLDIVHYVRDQLVAKGQDVEWNEVEKQFIHESRGLNMLLPGAAELLEFLESNHHSFGILTYGNPMWQRMKMTAAGFKYVPHIITESKEKGRFIRHWQQPDQTFAIPEELGGGTAETIVLIDDKADSFIGFPDAHSKGYWVLDPAHELPAQQGSVPVNVDRYANLTDLLNQL
jgi:phosphoglycolate phosphatase-like HAD superfamily hydrolase